MMIPQTESVVQDVVCCKFGVQTKLRWRSLPVILILSCWLCTTGTSQIQSNIKNIKSRLVSAQGKEKFDMMNDLAWEYRFANPDSSINIAEQAYRYGQSIELQKGLARALNIHGISLNYKGEKLAAYDFYSKALEVSLKQNDSNQIAYTHNNIGRVFQEQGLAQKAFPNIVKALEIFEQLKDSTGLAYCYQSLGNLYQSQRNFPKAEENYLKALQIRVKLSNQRNIHGGYYLIGRLYAEQGLVDQSLKFLLKADSVGRKLDDEIQLAETWIYLSKNYLQLGQKQKADSLLNVSLQIIRNKNSVRILSNGLLIGGEVAMARGDNKKAHQLLKEALVNARNMGDLSVTQDVYHELWKLSESMHDQMGALSYYNSYLLVRDTLKSLDVARQEEQLKFERQILVRERENETLKSENTAIEQRQRFQLILFASISISILAIGGLIWWNGKRLSKVNMQLARQNEQLIQVNHEKDSLMSIVAHDLKSPLSKIQGLNNLLKMDGTLSGNQLEYVALMDQVSKEGLSFISDLLSVHALEEKKPTITTFDLAELAKMKVAAFQVLASAKAIQIDIETTPTLIKSDQDYLSRVIDNLVSNAIKFSPKGSPVAISVMSRHDHAVIAVKDNGPGFSEKDKTQMFKKFKRLSARPTAGEASNGLGLAIVKTLVNRLKGTIELESIVGKGSVFTIQLPVTFD